MNAIITVTHIWNRKILSNSGSRDNGGHPFLYCSHSPPFISLPCTCNYPRAAAACNCSWKIIYGTQIGFYEFSSTCCVVPCQEGKFNFYRWYSVKATQSCTYITLSLSDSECLIERCFELRKEKKTRITSADQFHFEQSFSKKLFRHKKTFAPMGCKK